MQITSANLRAQAGVAEPFSWIDAAGTRLALSRRGAGAPVLCLHAIAHGGRDFEAFWKRMHGKGFEIVCLDWPGQGQSPDDATGAEVSAGRYAQILAGVIAAAFVPGDPPIVIGNSIGGAAAMIVAAQQPALIRALVLCNPGGLVAVDGFARTFCAAMAGFFRAGARGAIWFSTAFAIFYKTVLPGRPAREQRQRIVAAGRETAGVLAQAWASFGRPEADIRALLWRIDRPMLFAWAKGDRIVSWARNRPAVSRSSAEVQMFRGGHSAFMEDPDAFTAAFEAFARQLPERSA
jgi:4,5:9,10-diseco-3-hydroxy-5,9,17-trioxoandrosta-1(10),2-diene-4-oate hydrolase